MAEWKEKSKVVDAERKRIRDTLDALKEEIRAPLTEWENREKARVAGHEANIAAIIAAGRNTMENWQALPLATMHDTAKQLEADKTDWQEFAARGNQAITEAVAAIGDAIRKRETYEAEQAELTRLRQEEAERKQREHEERLKAEAAAKAKAEAEEKARAAAAKAEQERLAIQHAKEAAEQRAKEAEEAARAAAEKAERDRIAALAQAKADAEAAAKRERERIEAEKKAEAEAAAKREADKKHRAAINNEVLTAILNLNTGIEPDGAKAIIAALAKGEIPHVKISY